MNFTSEPTTTQSSTTMQTTDLNFHILGFTAASFIIFAIVGTLGNLLAALSLLLSHKLRQSPSTVFMVNMSICLLPACALGLPIYGIGCIQQQYYDKILYPKWLKMAAIYMSYILIQVHSHTICALAFNRVVAVKWPQVYKRMMQPRWVKVYLLLIWVYSAVIYLPFVYGISYVNTSYVFFAFVLPVLFTGICYIIIYLQVRHSKQSQMARSLRKGAIENSTLTQWDEQVVRTILIIFVILVFCNFPHIVIRFVSKKEGLSTADIIIYIIFWMQICLDPVVYTVSSHHYREAAREFLKCFIYPCFSATGDAHTASQTKSTIEVSV